VLETRDSMRSFCYKDPHNVCTNRAESADD